MGGVATFGILATTSLGSGDILLLPLWGDTAIATLLWKRWSATVQRSPTAVRLMLMSTCCSANLVVTTMQSGTSEVGSAGR